ncbi:MAG: universal stress protein [Crocinitomicaceae bacterium]|nr:universal stress protein [Crocinitomicaceae bacterium]
MKKNLYFVPHDLTEVGDSALNYALHICEKVDAEIRILHLVPNKTDVLKATAKIDAIFDALDEKYKAKVTKQIVVGSIFEDIGKLATKEGAQLIIMGTHGQKGFQKLFMSYAMQVITSCDIPFVIVQKNTPVSNLDKIVIPIDLSKESLQVVNIAGDLAAMFDAEVHVIGEKQTDEFLNITLKNRIYIINNRYEERNIKCHIEQVKSGGSYSVKVLEYAEKNKIDMIAIAYHTESILPQFDKFAQNLITNEKMLPCLVLNSKLASSLYY